MWTIRVEGSNVSMSFLPSEKDIAEETLNAARTLQEMLGYDPEQVRLLWEERDNESSS